MWSKISYGWSPTSLKAVAFVCLLIGASEVHGSTSSSTSSSTIASSTERWNMAAPSTVASRHSPRSAPVSPVYEKDSGLLTAEAFRKSSSGLASVFSNFAVVSKRVQNELCKNHSMMYLKQLDNFTLWAVEMFDSTTKFPEGLLAGNTYQLGAFDECIAVEAYLAEGKRGYEKKSRFNGQYCLADVQLLPPEFDRNYHTYDYIKDANGSAWEGLKAAARTAAGGVSIARLSSDQRKHRTLLMMLAWLSKHLSCQEFDLSPLSSLRILYTGDLRVRRRDVFHWAFCIPSSCRPIDLQVALEDAMEWVQREHGISMTVRVEENMCQVAERPPLSAGAITVSVVMSLFVIAVIIATIYDAFVGKNRRNDYGIAEKVIISFSACANLRQLLKTETSKEELTAIHGVRFYSMMLIILGHRCMFSFGGPLHNPKFVEYIYTEAINMFLLNGPIIVDTFFLLSGFLTCYLLILELEKRKRYNVFVLYLHRYIRLTPVYMVIVAFYATLFRRVGRGPLWEAKVGLETERCQLNWWTNLLYLNNYVNTKQLCMFQSWYVTCDMHFFLLAPLLAYLLWRWPRYGRIALFLVTFLSVVVPFAVTYIAELDAVLLLYMTTLSDPVNNETFRSVYITSHNRASPYYLGMMWGYVYYKIKVDKIKIPRMTYLGLWLVFMTTALASMFGAWIFYLPGRPYSRLESAFYGGLHRAGWGLSIGWLVVASDIGLAGPLTPLFKWSAVIPLSRLTYCAFLIHGGVQLFSIATMRTPEYMTFYKLFWMTSADIFFTFMFAVLVSLVFESPICSLEKVFLKGGKKREIDKTQESVLVPFENHAMTIPQ